MNNSRKHSSRRDAILGSIRATTSHPSAEHVYTELKPVIPSLSLGTVYRNIAILREEGAIISVGVVKGEERFDANVMRHAHFVCQTCGAVLDVGDDEDRADIVSLERHYGIKITRRELTYYGTCGDCAG